MVEVGPTIVVAVMLVLVSPEVGVDAKEDEATEVVKDSDADPVADVVADDNEDSGWDAFAVFAPLPFLEDAEARAPPTPPPTAPPTTSNATTTRIQNVFLRKPQTVFRSTSCVSGLYGYLYASLSGSM